MQLDPTLKTLLLMAAGSVIAVLFGTPVGIWVYRLNKRTDQKTQKVVDEENEAKAEVKLEKAKVVALERKVQALEAQVEAQTKAAIPLTAALEQALIAKLINDHTPEADALLKKLNDKTLTVDDAVRFAELMKERETDGDPRIGRQQQLAAEMLPLAIEMRKLEEGAPCETKTIAVTVPTTETVAAQDGGTQEKEKDN